MIKAGAKKRTARARRHTRIRSKVRGTEVRPRLAVFKSNRFLSAQLINDDASVTLVSVTTHPQAGTIDTAFAAGKKIAEEAKKKGVTACVFDRGGFIYTGKVKSFAEGAREGGLTF